jgi:hydroxymethylpyrimidine pyrophosphatase-like HAD family hydrolase
MSLTAEETKRAFEILRELEMDFMIHLPIPDNHHFLYVASGRNNPDFLHRIELYEDFGRSLDGDAESLGAATQLLAIEPAETDSRLEIIRERLFGFNVMRTTSPLDGRSRWIEIFPGTVSKGLTAEWLTGYLNLDPLWSLSIGNDYNDIDLLEWAERSFVVSNAPEELRQTFDTVASNDDSGLTDAVQRWLREIDSSR